MTRDRDDILNDLLEAEVDLATWQRRVDDEGPSLYRNQREARAEVNRLERLVEDLERELKGAKDGDD
jgi:hypothetical protein